MRSTAELRALPDTAQLPPHDAEAELAVVGAMLTNDTAVGVAESVLSAEDFYLDSHGQVFACIVKMHGHGRHIDAVTVGSELPRLKDLIVHASETLGTVSNLRDYCAIVSERATMRRVIRTGNELVLMGGVPTDDIDKALDEAEQKIMNIRPDVTRRGGSLGLAAQRVYEEVEAMEPPKRLSTGFTRLDQKIGGLYEGNLVIIGARPGVGKTALGLNLAMHVGKEGTVIFFSLEMSQHEVAQRALSCLASVPLKHLRDHTASPDQLADLNRAREEVMKSGVMCYDDPAMTPASVRSTVRNVSTKRRVDLIVIDYLQLMTMGKRQESRHVEVSGISRELKALARETKCPVVALSQLNRQSEDPLGDKKAKISQLRESGSLEQDADQVWLMYKPEADPMDPQQNTMIVDVQKNRHGECGEVRLHWQPMFTRFQD